MQKIYDGKQSAQKIFLFKRVAVVKKCVAKIMNHTGT